MIDKTLKELQDWAQKLDVNELFSYSTSDELVPNEKQFLYTTARKLKAKDNISYKALN